MDNSLELWQKTLELIKKDLNESDYDRLFANLTTIHKFENNNIYIVVPNNLDKFRIEKFYLDKLNHYVGDLSEDLVKFKFLTKSEAEKDLLESKKDPFITPNIRQLDRTLSPVFTFNNFEVGESNRFAFLAAMKVAETPEKIYNPLYIFGDVGLGKTHLMTAIGNYMLDNKTDLNIVYVSSQKFAEDYFLASSSKKSKQTIEDFYEKYNTADVLLVDDIQFLEKKTKTQEEFFKIFENLVNQKKQIVLTSDRSTSELKDIMTRLVSRFNWGLSVDIKAPDKNLRINILKNKLSSLIKDPNDVPVEALDAIAEFFQNNIRDLEGALRTYVTYCICLNVPFSVENVYIALERLLPKNAEQKIKNDNSDVGEKIMQTVAEYFKISTTDLLSTSRKQQIAYARHLAMYIIRSKFNVSLKTIGDLFGGRDHATVSHSIDKMEKILESDHLAKQDVDTILKNIENK